MPPPNPFPCGGKDQQPCPPQPASVELFGPQALNWTHAEVLAYGKQCWDQAIEHASTIVDGVCPFCKRRAPTCACLREVR